MSSQFIQLKLSHFLGLLLLCLTVSASAAPFTIAADQQQTSLSPFLRLLEDPTGQLEFAQIQTPEFQKKLKPLQSSSVNFGFTRSAYWVSFTLRNSSDQALQLLIRQDYPLIDHLNFWAPNEEGGWQEIATGDRLPFDSRPLALRDFIFPVKIPPQSERTYYLRFATEGALNIGLSVGRETALLNRLSFEHLLLGIYYGGFLVLIVYNLLLFTAVRESTYTYYMGFALSYGLYFSVHNGVAFQFLWPSNIWLSNEGLLILLGLSLTFSVQFSRKICTSSQLTPRTDRVMHTLMIALIALTAATPFFNYQLMALILSTLTLLTCILFLILGIITVIRGSISARYFLSAWATLLLSGIVYLLKTFGLLPHNVITQNAYQVGALLEMVLLSLALGARVNELQKLGYTDQLSGLYNRRCFDEKLSREFDFASKSGTPLSLLLIDLDNFKNINDHYGHHQGDLSIRAIGQLIRKQVRRPVLAFRYGGDEFAILLPRTNEDQATALAARLMHKVSHLKIGDMSMTASIGVAGYEGGNFEMPAQLFKAADAALYKAKTKGRNRVASNSIAPNIETTRPKNPARTARSGANR